MQCAVDRVDSAALLQVRRAAQISTAGRSGRAMAWRAGRATAATVPVVIVVTVLGPTAACPTW